MKIQWEEKDIICGRFVHLGEIDPKHITTRLYMLGYVNGSSKDGMTLISIADGLVCNMEGMSKLDMAKQLNKDNYIPIICETHFWPLI